MSSEIIFKEDYKGPVWVYGCELRPPGIGAVPQGRLIGGDRPKGPGVPFRHGVIEYPRALTEAEIAGYELVLFSAGDKDSDRDRVRAMLGESGAYRDEDQCGIWRFGREHEIRIEFDDMGKFYGFTDWEPK